MCLFALLMLHATDARRAQRKLKNIPRTRCTATTDGKILSGNTCKFSCCLALKVRKMTSGAERKQCPSFKRSGKSCFVDGTKYPHKWVIKYNSQGCYICNNGKQIHYKDANIGILPVPPPGLDEYTLIRFG